MFCLPSIPFVRGRAADGKAWQIDLYVGLVNPHIVAAPLAVRRH